MLSALFIWKINWFPISKACPLWYDKTPVLGAQTFIWLASLQMPNMQWSLASPGDLTLRTRKPSFLKDARQNTDSKLRLSFSLTATSLVVPTNMDWRTSRWSIHLHSVLHISFLLWVWKKYNPPNSNPQAAPLTLSGQFFPCLLKSWTFWFHQLS